MKNGDSNQGSYKKIALGAAIGTAAAINMTPVVAGDFSPGSQASHVNGAVTGSGPTWDYDYTVFNDGAGGSFPNQEGYFDPVIVDWELPYFDDAGITAIVSPVNWAYEIVQVGIAGDNGWTGVAEWQDLGDPFYFEDSPYNATDLKVLHWYNVCWFGSDEGSTTPPTGCEDPLTDAIGTVFNQQGLASSKDGFGFTAGFDTTNAPYQASWALLPIQSGDPDFPDASFGGIPGSPNALGIMTEPPSGVPAPGSLPLLGLGIAVGLTASWRRRKKST